MTSNLFSPSITYFEMTGINDSESYPKFMTIIGKALTTSGFMFSENLLKNRFVKADKTVVGMYQVFVPKER